jgi:PAS domain S-box-containing protein
VIWSDETYRIFGLTPQVGPIDITTVNEMIVAEDRAHVFRTADEAISSGTRAECEHRLLRPSGEMRIVHSLGDLKKDASGRPYQMFGTTQDITERKRAEQALQRSQFYLSEGERLAHVGSWASSDLVSVGLTIWVFIGLTRFTKFTALTQRAGPRTSNSIWPSCIHMIEPPWLKPSKGCMNSDVAAM